MRDIYIMDDLLIFFFNNLLHKKHDPVCTVHKLFRKKKKSVTPVVEYQCLFYFYFQNNFVLFYKWTKKTRIHNFTIN